MPIIFQILTPTSRIFGGAGKLSIAPVSSCCSGSDISNTLSPPSDNFATSWFLRPMIQIHSVAPAFQRTSHQTPATRKTKKTFQLMQKRNVWRWSSSTSVSIIRLASPPSESAALAAQAAAGRFAEAAAGRREAGRFAAGMVRWFYVAN